MLFVVELLGVGQVAAPSMQALSADLAWLCPSVSVKKTLSFFKSGSVPCRNPSKTLRGGKYSDWEGGVRTNAFVSGGFVPWPRRGTKFGGIISIAELQSNKLEIYVLRGLYGG